MYRISRNGHEPIVDVDQLEATEPVIRSNQPGRYHVDEFNAEPLLVVTLRAAGHSGSIGMMD